MTDHGTGPVEPRYRTVARIATGGMGEVWKATDTVLGRDVALKVLKPELSDDAVFRERFAGEARHAASVHHANVAAVFDFGELPAEDGSGVPRPYLVMELVPGQPLNALLRSGEPMPAETAADLVAQAADGVAAAHALGVVHRDIKPGNLLVTPDGTVKITDFGIARATDAAALTSTGQVLGTPQYLSPEQAEGKQATMASDIYALGVVLYECLAGRRPFERETPVATALAHLRDEPPPLPDTVPAHLRDVVGTALAKDPAARFASAGELAAALRGHAAPATSATAVLPAAGAVAGAGAAGAAAAAAAGGTQVLSTPPAGAPVGGSRAADRRRRLPGWLPWAGAALAVLLVVLGVAALSGGGDDPAASTDTDTSAAASDTPSPTRSESPTPTPTPEPTGPVVDAADYVGAPHDEAKKALEELGFKVHEEKVPNPGDQEEGTVADVSPTGEVDPDQEITLSVWDKAAEAPEPGKGHGKGKDKKR